MMQEHWKSKVSKSLYSFKDYGKFYLFLINMLEKLDLERVCMCFWLEIMLHEYIDKFI